jgi:putative FmdB family regulatory protein
MPIFEYVCSDCEVQFEQLHVLRDDIEAYKDSHPCPSCSNPASRNRVSAFGFKFAGEVRGTSGVHGNSGVHDLDYPKLDKAVGRSSEKKWEKARELQGKISKVRKESGSQAVSIGSDGVPVSAPTSLMNNRERILKKAKE